MRNAHLGITVRTQLLRDLAGTSLRKHPPTYPRLSLSHAPPGLASRALHPAAQLSTPLRTRTHAHAGTRAHVHTHTRTTHRPPRTTHHAPHTTRQVRSRAGQMPMNLPSISPRSPLFREAPRHLERNLAAEVEARSLRNGGAAHSMLHAHLHPPPPTLTPSHTPQPARTLQPACTYEARIDTPFES